MKKANVEGIEKMMGDYLQYLWRKYLISNEVADDNHKGKNNADFIYYCGATDLIQAIGGTWERSCYGENYDQYSHWVKLPNDERCKRLNFNAWGD